VNVAAGHGAPHPADPHAHGQAQRADHEVTHGPAEPHDAPHGSAVHGHGPWHGPHESPAAMTYPLVALAVGAVIAGFVGIPAAIGGSNEIEHFLEPSFTAQQVRLKPDTAETRPATTPDSGSVRLQPDQDAAEHETTHASTGVEIGLMLFSLLVAVGGILLAYRFYIGRPETSERLARRWSFAHRTLLNKYYVDELYDSTVVSGTMASARGLWTVDRNVVDGAVNGSGRVTIISSWFSGLTDRTVVDGLVNLVGWIVQESSHTSRRLQTGLVQNYALLMLFGIFAFVSWYLFMR
jgi:NADH-quinone oxidoreductase subunit L